MHRYIVWFITTLFVVYAFCLNTASAVFSQSIKMSLNATDFNISLAMSAFILAFASMQIPAGFLLDKFNARYVVSSAVILLALGNLLLSYADSLAMLATANFLQGIGASFAFVSAAVLISQWFSEKQFPILFGLTQAISCILAAVIHYSFTIALTHYSWNEIYRFLSLMGLTVFVLSILLISPPPDKKHTSAMSLRTSLAVVFQNRQILLCSLAAATSFGVLLTYAGFWYFTIQAYYSVANLQSVAIGGAIFLGIGVGTPLFGWLSNKVKSRVMVIHVTLCLGTMALLAGIYLPHFNMSTLIFIKIISFLIGLLLSGSMLFYTMVNELSTDATRGVSISVLNTAVFLFNTLMIFMPYAFITTQSTNYFTYLWVLPFFILISILSLYFIKDSYSSK